MAEKSSFIDALQKGLADAVTDIREKVVEEPWFGKTVTQGEEKAVMEQREEVPGWGSKIRQAEIGPPEQDRESEIER